uniref:Uncharacterized protein n=1 Tax=Sphenodon punctatus TaxID=8508 RepID=A0A8D0GQZ9_SPHPU
MQLGRSLRVGENAFENVANLTFLDLGGNRNLSLHPAALAGLAKLEVLLLDANGLGEEVLEGGYFRDLVSLRRLDLTGNRITRLRHDPTFQGLAMLSSLQLKLNRLETLCGDDLQHLAGRRLELLDLASNRLSYRAACPGPFRNLSLGTLDVSSNPWDVAGAERFFAGLDGAPIRHLRMQHSGAVGRGFGFHNLRGILASTFMGLFHSDVRSFDMSHGFLAELGPSSFAGLPGLHALILTSNQISQIDGDAFAGLQALQTLDLSHNLLGALYGEAFQPLRGCPLQHLSLRSNHLGIIQHNALAGLGFLRRLDLRDNALPRVPSGHLPTLQHLLLAQNRIDSAWGLGQLCRNLTHLDFSANRLRDLGQLWAQLGHLPNLRFLNASGNQLAVCSG